MTNACQKKPLLAKLVLGKVACVRHPGRGVFGLTVIRMVVNQAIGVGLLQHLIQSCTGELDDLIHMAAGNMLVDGRGV